MSAGNIKVVVRVRPFNSREKDRGAKCIVQMKDSQTILTPPPGVTDSSAPRKGASTAIKADGPKMGYGEEYGIIPRICQNIFERISSEKDPNIVSTIEVSYLEIYNEKVRDLLNPSNKGALKVREHPSLGPYVEDLAKLVVTSFREIENLMDEGNKARTVAATNMNETSSRSHAVFTLILTQKRHDVETGFDTEKVSRISLVDLAGSERATSTGATGARLKEGAEINRSLSTLGRVIAALADLSSGGKKKGTLVPYRDSVLTWLLKDSLGGNSMTAMIAAISPADINWDETLSTLRYADSAKRIKNHAVVNEDPNARMIRELKEELSQLRQKLSGGGGAEEEKYDASVPLEKQIVTITSTDGSVRKVSKAEIAEQLGASEKLLKEVNQTWEEKLEKTQQIQKEREAALEELGISIEKDFIGMSMPKRIPHLVNLSDDPLLAECLVYNIKAGDTTVGNVESATTTAQIKLNGSKILPDHCRFENVNDVVTLIPNEGAAVMVNGLRIEGPKRLRTGYRVILGDFHIFRFNHPNEARAERDKLHRQSLAGTIAEHRHTNSNGGFMEGGPGSDAESSRPDSPALVPPTNKEIDWSFAQREALMAQGLDPIKINGMSDEELNALLQGVQKAYNLRRGKVDDDDLESVASVSAGTVGGDSRRERYTSNGTIDNFSLDTSLTVPGTPQRDEEEEKVRVLKEELQVQLEAQKEFQERLKVAEETHVVVEEIKAQKIKMEEELKAAEKKLEDQKKEWERRHQEMELKLEEMALSPQVRSRAVSPTPPRGNTPSANDLLSKRQKNLARAASQLWRRSNYVRMAESVLQYAATLKEAQIMSNEMEKRVFFQFTVVDVGHTSVSTYDLLINGVNADDDEALELAPKPCVAVRAMDFNRNLIHLWSLEKLQLRIRQMKQIYQYLSRPDYLSHVQGNDPFSEPILPDYTLLGDSDVPLAAIFQSKRQSMDLEVISPHTCSVIGIVKVTLEPSTVEVPKGNIGFNVVIHQLLGISEREGTDIHAQLFLPWLDNAPATVPVSGFDEGPVNFESTHVLTAPLSARIKGAMLRVSIFGKVTGMHLERLMSWDEMRDQPEMERKGMRLHENEFYTEEKHDVFAKCQVLELQESGEYTTVEVLQVSESDQGSFQLHHGVQRRVQVWMVHSSGDMLPLKDVARVVVKDVCLVGEDGQAREPSSTKEVELRIVKGPSVKKGQDGSWGIGVVAQWDSSAHNSVLLDRMTAPKYRVQVTISWELVSDRLAENVVFSHKVCLEIRPRLVRGPNMLGRMIRGTRTVGAVAGMFQVTVKPQVSRRAGDLWRMNSSQRYVKGEEVLRGWTPRGISIIKDYLAARRRRMRVAEVEAVKPFLKPEDLEIKKLISNGHAREGGEGEEEEEEELTEEKKAIIEKFLKMWPRDGDPFDRILSKQNIEPPQDGASTAVNEQPVAEPEPPKLVAEALHSPKNPKLQKSGYVFRPNDSTKKWEKQYLELRKPYLHIHNGVTGEELMAVNLSDCTLDYEPANGMGELMAKDNVFAIYAPQSSYRFATRTEKDKMDWIVAIDNSYFSEARGEGGGRGER
ncbi:kinesin-like protein Klp8 [Orbilia oligospora]|uniref:Kinesin-like protein Klp8 n=1 Tax=Orbilia oligospora TaxID=2813651 RepID=A0A8H8V2P4_ORBOL|nr:kinesin-like protein Klp8 [Orbilia oligospora]